MNRSKYLRALGLAVAAVLGTGTLTSGPALADGNGRKAPAHETTGDVRPAPLDHDAAREARRSHFTNTGHVGDVVAWPAYQEDDRGDGSFYLKDFRLRGLGPHVEVWVAEGDDVSRGLDYPAGDCRNGARTTVTDQQVSYLIDQYETVMRPAEDGVFGAMKARNGKDAVLPKAVPSVPANAYRGPGDRLAVLVDNFREPGFTTWQPRFGYQGLVSDQQIRLTDRNVLNLRGTDWAWHLGADPQPDAATRDHCTEVPSVPHFVEAVLAHELTHVHEASAGDNEEALTSEWSFISEGVAAWAAHLTGYVDPAVDDARNAQVECFLGESWVHPVNYLHRCLGGPENSLTVFGDNQAPGADYGAAETFMEMLDGRYGHRFMGDLVRTVGVWGPDKIDRLLADRGETTDFEDLVADWSAALALDGVLDDGAVLLGGDAARYEVPGLHAGVAWDSPYAYVTPVGGTTNYVQRNGSNFVRLRDSAGQWLDAAHLESLDIDAATRVACEWEIDPDGHGPGDATFSSRNLNGQDEMVATALDVPTDAPVLGFDTKYDIETGWDFGYVQVSTDGGATWQSLSTADTTSAHDPQAASHIVAALPGFTGSSGGWVHERADLSPWAGQHVMVGFRYRTDWGVTGAGFSVDNVTVGDLLVSDGSSFDGWQQLAPRVHRLDVRIVSYTDDHRVASITTVPLDGENDAHLAGDDLRALVAPGAQTVGVIVTDIQRDEFPFCGVRYRLAANGVTQGFGGPTP